MPERARAFVLVLTGVLLALAATAVLFEARNVLGAALLAAGLVVPLLLPLRGLLRRERRVYGWATLCLTPHFVYGLTELVANPALRGLAAAVLLASLALMVALVAYLRLTRGS